MVSIRILFIFSIAYAISGCVAIRPFPQVARAGDTITLAIGSLDKINRSNTAIVYVPDSDPTNPIDLTSNIRSILNIYPDKTSKAYWDTTSGSGLETMTYQSTLSNHGPWQTVLVLDLPVTMPPGTGHFTVTPGPEVLYPATVTKVGDVNIDMEILADSSGNALVGAPHDFEYRKFFANTNTNIGDLTALEKSRQAVVRYVVNSSSTSTSAAAYYKLSVPIVDQYGNDVSDQVSDGQIAVVLDDQPKYVVNQTNLIWSRQGSQFKVLVTNVSGNQIMQQIRFSILVRDESLETANGWILSSTPSLLSVQYFDKDGNVITGPHPKVELL